MIVIGILGGLGKTGSNVIKVVHKHYPNLIIGDCYTRKKDLINTNVAQHLMNNLQMNVDNIDEGAIFTDNLSQILEKSDIIIDFSSIELTKLAINENKKYKKTFISGVSGLNDEDIKIIQECSKYFKICTSGNTSNSVILINKILKIIVENLKDYDCDIIEKHHKWKKDSPSGTAFLFANTIAKIKKIKLDDIFYDPRKNIERKSENISISSIRGADIVGEHEILFNGLMDSISIKHIASNREIFAKGAIDLGLKLFNSSQKNGLFTAEEILFNEI